MSDEGPPRLVVLSSRPDILVAVAAAAEGLEPRPQVTGFAGRSVDPGASDLILVDIAEPRATVPYVRRRVGEKPSLVALIEAAWIGKLGAALSGDWTDYLFYPLNRDELGLVWRRHTSRGQTPDLSLDVDESGRILAVIPSQVSYQRPVVERVVEACRHLADLDADTSFRLRVALGEAVANAILYGSGGNPSAMVRITAAVEPGGLRVSVQDEGEGFDLASIPDPTTDEGIGRSRGRGLFLLREVTDELTFNRSGNEVRLFFRGGLDALRRIEPWLPKFAELTGLCFRLDRVHDGETECVFDSCSGSPPDATGVSWQSRSIGREGALRLEYEEREPGSGADTTPAAELLAGWLNAVAESEEARERLIERRMLRSRVLAELELARDLQLRLLPAPDDFRDLAEVAARCEPALSLGGDFYYLTRLPESRLGIMLGDVSSHGPSAALIMALTLSAAAMVTGLEARPAATLDAMHGQLLTALESTEMYMTLFYAVLDSRRQQLSFANAGHPYAYRLAAGAAHRLPALDPPLGMVATPGYAERSIPWSGADTLLAFTDGLVERQDPLDDPESALRGLVDRGDLSPGQLIDALFTETDEDLRLDDRTAVAVRP